MSSRPNTPDAGKALDNRRDSGASHHSRRPKPQFSKSVQFFVNNRGRSPVATETSPSNQQAVNGLPRPSSRASDSKSGQEPTERTGLLGRRRATSVLSLQNTISSAQTGETEEDDYLKAGHAQAGDKTKPVWYLFLLTLAIGG